MNTNSEPEMDQPELSEEAIFEAARQLGDLQELAAYLQRVCGDDQELRQRVERLLRAGQKAKEFFQKHNPAAAISGDQEAAALGSEEGAGSVIGRYKLLQRLGEGGMGVVYMAQQEEPVRRKVALKIIKLGMDTRQIVARFEAERQALALMDHPNIARVFDGGATETGRPYFVMELVQGVALTEFCDKNHLTVQERLKLFIPVCQAIQSAHQKGIIHRDLKPSNILVTLNPDGSGFPKVIDFGVAKATSQKLTEKTLFTAHGMMVGTPAYMSPEQAEMSHLDVDTRADIYSLGALLYELLTGSPPFPEQRLRSAGYNEMQRIILEEQPVKPSTRLSTLQGEQRTIVARNRNASEMTLGRALPGDLDSIVMKCLEKDRARRYETANGLANDLQRHLRNEPVTARPPSRLYEFQKTVRRHWVGFVAMGAVMTALAIGALISWRAEVRARQRLAESEAISKFLSHVFRSPDPDRDGRTITVAESLGAAAAELETELSRQPGRRAKLQETLALTYKALGLDLEAIALQQKVHDYYLSALGPEHLDTVSALGNLANSYWRVGRRDEAIKLQQQVLALSRKVSGSKSEETLKAMENLGISYAEAGRPDEAVNLLEEALTVRRKLKGPEHPDTLVAIQNLAGAVLRAGHPDRAAKLLEEALPICRKLKGPERPDTLYTMHNLAFVYAVLGRLQEALNLQEQVLALSRKVLGPEHPGTLDAMQNLLESYFRVGRWDEGIKVGVDLLQLRRKLKLGEHPDTLKTMWRLAEGYCAVGRSREALSLLEEVCRLDPKDPSYRLALATFQTWFGLDAEYEATRRRLLEEAQQPDRDVLAGAASMACCLRPSTNAALVNKTLELAEKAAELNKTNARSLLFVGLAQYRNGRYAAAEHTLTSAEHAKQTLSAADQFEGKGEEIAGEARFFRALSLFHQGRTNEARALFGQAEVQMPPFPKDEAKPFAEAKPPNQSYDMVIWWLAYKEARGELGKPSPAPTEAPK